MTDRLIQLLSRQPAHRLARPLAAFCLAVALAFGGALWLTAANRVEIVGDLGQRGFLATWLRDATLVLPVVFLAVWLALVVTRRVLARAEREPSLLIGSALLTVLVGAFAAMVTAFVWPVRALAGGSTFVATDLGFSLHVVRDALIGLPVHMLLAGAFCAALARRRPWEAPQVASWDVAGRRRRVALQTVVAVATLAPVVLLAQIGTQRAVAAGPGTPCPAGSPVRTFDVRAINVDIPLNRFGDHDSAGRMYALASRIPAIRAQEASRQVSAGLRDDPIQPLVIRANMGDCVQINFRNDATGEFGVHIDGLSFDVGSSGDAVGNNDSSSVTTGAATLYRYYVPKDPELEGARYIRPGPGNRDAVSHGLFGVLVVEPEGSQYLHPDTGAPLADGWGWEATIVPPNGKAFRESALLHHEIGDEKYIIPSAAADSPGSLPVKDPHTTSYRPASRALNYRSEPFMHRLGLDTLAQLKAFAYNSYTFGDPATPMMRGYLGDPTKIRLVHAGSELFHVYHLHGGGDRWRSNPKADPTFNYGDTGLNKNPEQLSKAHRLDTQSTGPGESYNLEIEGGAGGVQQAPGDFLYHCHIAEHYVSGMWSVWRVFDTRQPNLAPLPDRAPPPTPVDSTGLIGRTMPDGTTITAGNLGQWVEPMLPPPGVRLGAPGTVSLDSTVWNWRRGDVNPANANVYFGEPEDTSGSIVGSPWQAVRFPNLMGPGDGNVHAVPGHPGLMPVDAMHTASNDARPRILFNPNTGRPAYPLLRPHIGQRPPFSPNGHSGAPFLGERANAPKSNPGQPDPWAGRPDGLCPSGAPSRPFNLVSIQLPNQVTAKGATDPFGKVFVLAKNKDKVRNGQMPIEPLAIRGNTGDCIELTATSEQDDSDPNQPFSMTNVHIHHVQFDPNGSDGATAGMVYGQAVRPYRLEDAQLASGTSSGATQLQLTLPGTPGTLADFAKFRVGVWIGVGLGTEDIEVRRITAVAPGPGADTTVTLNAPLAKSHSGGQWVGTEFVRETWFPDVVLDNIFWHDHVDGIHNWGHGLVGQLIIEPKGSTYHDPVSGAQVDSGTLVDIRTNNPLFPGVVDGSFREFVMWTINQNPTTDSTINIKAEPLSDRRAANPDPSLLYSSYTHGDPFTPLPRAYAGDPFVIRAINVSSAMDTFFVDGHKVYTENRMTDGSGKLISSPISAVVYGISERFSLALAGGAGGPGKRAGDYRYGNGLGRRTEHGAWGIIRVLPRQVGNLQPLPGTNVPTGQTDNPSPTGQRPPAAGTPGEPCPAGAPLRTFNVSAVQVPGLVLGRTLAYVPTAQAAAVKAGTLAPEPLALRVAAGECVVVNLTNEMATGRVSFHVNGKIGRDIRSSGVNVGYNPEQTVAPGASRAYKFHVDADNLGAAVISDQGGDDTGVKGLYGAMIVAPAGSVFVDPLTGAAKDVGTQVDVRPPGASDYRDFALFFSENDPFIGGNTMPYPPGVESHATVNYASAGGRALDAAQFSSLTNGDPPTPLLRAYPGDAMKVHVIGAPGGEQAGVFTLGGHTWAWDAGIPRSEQLHAQQFGPLTTIDASVRGGAGRPGDYVYGNIRRPYTDVGQWGLLRVLAPGSGPIRALASNPQPVRPRGRITSLSVARSIARRTVTGRGIAFTFRGPSDITAVRAKLYRIVRGRAVLVGGTIITTLTQQQRAKLTKSALAKRSKLTVSSAGIVRATWRPSPALLRKLAAGRYRLDVQAGPTRTRITAQTLRRLTRLTAPPVVRAR